ncbi:gluconokinase [Myxococcus sp. K38C18041901]|uniref:gluconokinase n=1 Tax=Myxococcus guangdongensis TaxID=2906760 RepID=UPI0020A6DC74|nr:gluconokinase [Myxococcus guangdongensis]MCP3064724.1 gluconokinase [Myxococcus guangdongensis]
MVVVVMGVSGAGKSTVGRALAQSLGWRFLDTDDLHSAANVAKMAAGVPLTDEDRWPWLADVRGELERSLSRGEDVVLASSALKRSYRERLEVDPARTRWVYLNAPREVLSRRLAQRHGHFMPPSLLDSQLAALEVPEQALSVDVSPPPEQIVASIRAGLKL